MTPLKRRTLFLEVLEAHRGKPCPCCLERDELEAKDASEWLSASFRLFKKVFGTSVIGPDAVVAFRLVPVPVGVAKRGEAFFYLKENLFPACCESCRLEYQNMWLYHPKRVAFIEHLLEVQRTANVKLKRR